MARLLFYMGVFMRILATDTFLDEKDKYEKDVEYDVPDEKGYYFIANHWALNTASMKESKDPVAEAVDLDIQNSTIGMKDSNG